MNANVACLFPAILALLVWASPSAAQEPRSVPDIGIELVPIPAGRFLMGSPPDEPEREDDENPQTRVSITRPWWLGKYEVSHGQYRALLGTDLAVIARDIAEDPTLYDMGSRGMLTSLGVNRLPADAAPEALLGDTASDVAIYLVSWEDAVRFCRALTERERIAGRLPPGYVYRLPTDAEWEYAARAGSTGAIYAGELKVEGLSNAPALDPIAWYAGNSTVGYEGKGFDVSFREQRQYSGSAIAGPRRIGLKQPNAWGLHDMIGNVWEWAADWYEPQLPGGSVSDPTGPVTGTRRVVRGGGWNNPVADNRLAQRYGIPAGKGGRVLNLGFRVALAPELD